MSAAAGTSSTEPPASDATAMHQLLHSMGVEHYEPPSSTSCSSSSSRTLQRSLPMRQCSLLMTARRTPRRRTCSLLRHLKSAAGQPPPWPPPPWSRWHSVRNRQELVAPAVPNIPPNPQLSLEENWQLDPPAAPALADVPAPAAEKRLRPPPPPRLARRASPSPFPIRPDRKYTCRRATSGSIWDSATAAPLTPPPTVLDAYPPEYRMRAPARPLVLAAVPRKSAVRCTRGPLGVVTASGASPPPTSTGAVREPSRRPCARATRCRCSPLSARAGGAPALPGGPLRSAVDDNDARLDAAHVLAHLDFGRTPRFNSDAAGAVLLSSTPSSGVGLLAWHPGCSYGCAPRRPTLRLQPNEVRRHCKSTWR